MCIEELEEDKVEDHHFVEAQIVQKDAREKNVVAKKEQLSTEIQLNTTSHKGVDNGKSTMKGNGDGAT